MHKLLLKEHKKAAKLLEKVPMFRPVRRGRLQRPFHRLGGPSVLVSGVIPVAPDYVVLLFYKDGNILTDTHFYGYLLYRAAPNDLYPLFEFHWHPGHKGFHCKTPCQDERDFTNRTLPGVVELSMKTQQLDPRTDAHRTELIRIFCSACGIRLGWESVNQGELWN